MLLDLGGLLWTCAPQCGPCVEDWHEDEEVVDREVFELELLAHAAARNGDMGAASGHLTAALKHCPRTPHLLNARAVVSYAQGHYDEAAADLKEACELAPATSLYRYNLGQTLAAQHHVRDAAKELRAAFALDPSLTQGYPRYSKTKWKILCPKASYTYTSTFFDE